MTPNEWRPRENKIRLERDDASVRIMTVHKSKGLSFQSCMLLFWLWVPSLNQLRPNHLERPETQKDPPGF